MKRKYMNVSILLFLLATGTTAYSQEMPKFTSDQEKEAWIKANPALYKEMENSANASRSIGNEPSSMTSEATPVKADGFPQYKETGDADQDRQAYEKAKEEWVKNNPEAYRQIQNAAAQTKTIQAVDLPGFPVYVSTGDKELDDATYRAAKEQWIENNRELYNSMFIQSTTTKENAINN